MRKIIDFPSVVSIKRNFAQFHCGVTEKAAVHMPGLQVALWCKDAKMYIRKLRSEQNLNRERFDDFWTGFPKLPEVNSEISEV